MKATRTELDLRATEAARLYTEKHLTLREIAPVLGVSHATVRNDLRRLNISIHDGEWVWVQCQRCGKGFEKTRGRVRNSKRNFCSDLCYYQSRINPNYVDWRHGTRIARMLVKKYFPLTPENIVHHKDTDQTNNRLANLAVFRNNSDHMKFHHGANIPFLWDGASYSVENIEN